MYDLSVLCAEVASHIGVLNSEWLGVLKALCCTSMHGLGFDDLQDTLDVREVLFDVINFVAKNLNLVLLNICTSACQKIESS